MWKVDTGKEWLWDFSYYETKKTRKMNTRSNDFVARIFNKSEKVRFRLLDDDKEEYFRGYMTRGTAEEDPFRPLDEYGKPGYGCTIIQLWERDRTGTYRWTTV